MLQCVNAECFSICLIIGTYKRKTVAILKNIAYLMLLLTIGLLIFIYIISILKSCMY